MKGLSAEEKKKLKRENRATTKERVRTYSKVYEQIRQDEREEEESAGTPSAVIHCIIVLTFTLYMCRFWLNPWSFALLATASL